MKQPYVLGIELGSTRIKSVLIDEKASVVAQGSYEWKSTLNNGLWSYPQEEMLRGLQASYADLAQSYQTVFGEELTELSAIGISAMMHGYLAFDENDRLLVPFRTWQNTNAKDASEELTEQLQFHVPMRWSASHYYQAILNREPHVAQVAYINTLSGYIHFLLSGSFVLGVCDASGMFPVKDNDYNAEMIARFNEMLASHGIKKDFKSMLPRVLVAGEQAGTLTENGARLLDPTGKLKAGCPLCPPEGDAGTGMIATNAITPKTANVSAGTSAFLMAVLERELDTYYREIDVINTPCGAPVAMVHANNFTGEMNAWAAMFEELLSLYGIDANHSRLFDTLYTHSLNADADCGGLVGYPFLAGEPIVGVAQGMPLITHAPNGKLTLANFMKMHIYSALAPLAVGMETLHREGVSLDGVCGHGGFFKTPLVGQRAMSAALGAPVTVMKNSGEGGAWGIALLALLTVSEEKNAYRFLDGIFSETGKTTLSATDEDKSSFAAFLKAYKAYLSVQKTAAEVAECSKN